MKGEEEVRPGLGGRCWEIQREVGPEPAVACILEEWYESGSATRWAGVEVLEELASNTGQEEAQVVAVGWGKEEDVAGGVMHGSGEGGPPRWVGPRGGGGGPRRLAVTGPSGGGAEGSGGGEGRGCGREWGGHRSAVGRAAEDRGFVADGQADLAGGPVDLGRAAGEPGDPEDAVHAVEA